MTEQYDRLYPSFGFDRPVDGILRITFDAPGLNAVSPEAHREIADVWVTIDRDPHTRVVVLQGAGKGFSSGGSFELLDTITSGYDQRARVMREARDLVRNIIECSKPIVSANPRSRSRRGLGRCAAGRRLGGGANRAHGFIRTSRSVWHTPRPA